MIELTHIGEELIAQMFNSSAEVKNLFLRQLTHSPSRDGDIVAVPEVPLAHYGSFGFDGAHRVDVGMLCKQSKLCIPVEAKLGTERMGQNAFESRFLCPCGTSHRNSRISGSMVAILERKLPASAEAGLEVCSDGIQYKLTQEWILVVREDVMSSWRAHGAPTFSPRCKIIAIEEVVSCFGDVTAFNDLVEKMVAADYHHQWFGGDSGSK